MDLAAVEDALRSDGKLERLLTQKTDGGRSALPLLTSKGGLRLHAYSLEDVERQDGNWVPHPAYPCFRCWEAALSLTPAVDWRAACVTLCSLASRGQPSSPMPGTGHRHIDLVM